MVDTFTRRQRRPWVWATLLLAVMSGGGLGAQRPPTEYERKAEFLLDFMKYVEWPARQTSAPLVVCVAGQNPFGQVLENLVRRERADGRNIGGPRMILEPEPGCDVIFVPRTANVSAYLRAAKGSPTLLVGDEVPRFLEQGGIINFRDEGGEVRFEIDADAALKVGLRISSRLLSLGWTPEQRDPE